MPNQERYEVGVRGVVQGVGFRPFIYRLAMEEHLAGSIGNDTDGVTIEIEGPTTSLNVFLTRLRSEAPPLSRIDTVTVRDIPPTGKTGFRIIASEVHGRVSTGIPADAATCPDCLRELLSPTDRRYRYPFLNCTNCGPRYTITRRIPYDRPQTSMAQFKMCPACQAEYDDPLNRRFHAQPNACWQCGPQLSLVELEGRNFSPSSNLLRMDGYLQAAENLSPERQEVSGHDFSRAEQDQKKAWALAPEGITSPDLVQQTIDLLQAGHILAIKGIGGFHLSVDATNETAVQLLRQRKRRYGKPLAVMVRDLEAARTLCSLTPEEEQLLTTPARPIVLLRQRDNTPIAPSVAPGIPWLGVFLPYAPLHHLLFADDRIKSLVMTSANLSEEPIAIDNDEARSRLAKIADAFLMHNREILQRCDDSVAAIVDGAPQLIRRARGFVPLGVPLPFDTPPLLAVGGHLKNVFALASGRFAYQSQHLGDLENLTGLNFFRESLDHLMRTFEIEPQTVVHDLHPGYLSTDWARQWAAERNLPLIAVQHHHAHIAACMAEHGVEQAIGLALDGTGYGTDGKIWGGEVLIARPGAFDRYAHLDYIAMPGGDAAVREPWRMALSALHAAGYDVNSDQILKLLGVQPGDARVVSRMIERKINSPETSSLGRLFDAVAAVILGRRTVDYEAQAAIELEGIADAEPDRRETGDFVLELWQDSETDADSAVLRTDKLWKAILNDLWRGVPASRISARFHAWIAEGYINAAANARIETSINHVAMSGGCMHNRRLTRLLRTGLEEEGFIVHTHRQVSPGDGGLSYGQAAVAAALLTSRIS